MLNRIFYHSTTRKLAILTGNLFNDIVVRRFNSDGTSLQTMTVPIQYAAKRKWVQNLNSETNRNVAMVVPRMSFSFTSFNYDTSRKSAPLNKIVGSKDAINDKLSGYNAIPYKVNFDLNIMTKNTDDMFQIVEQIIPFFNPSFSSKAELIPNLDYKFDVVFRYQGMSIEDVFDGQFEQRQMIVCTMTFEADYWYFGPIERENIIKRVIVNTDDVSAVIQPAMLPTNKPTTLSANSVSIFNIREDDDFGFSIDFKDNA